MSYLSELSLSAQLNYVIIKPYTTFQCFFTKTLHNIQTYQKFQVNIKSTDEYRVVSYTE